MVPIYLFGMIQESQFCFCQNACNVCDRPFNYVTFSWALKMNCLFCAHYFVSFLCSKYPAVTLVFFYLVSLKGSVHLHAQLICSNAGSKYSEPSVRQAPLRCTQAFHLRVVMTYQYLCISQIPAAPIPPPGQLRGICTHCQSRGSGISLPKGYPWAFDTRGF